MTRAPITGMVVLSVALIAATGAALDISSLWLQLDPPPVENGAVTLTPAVLLTSPDAKDQRLADAKDEAAAQSSPPADDDPAFDVARIEPSGDAVIAGRQDDEKSATSKEKVLVSLSQSLTERPVVMLVAPRAITELSRPLTSPHRSTFRGSARLAGLRHSFRSRVALSHFRNAYGRYRFEGDRYGEYLYSGYDSIRLPTVLIVGRLRKRCKGRMALPLSKARLRLGLLDARRTHLRA